MMTLVPTRINTTINENKTRHSCFFFTDALIQCERGEVAEKL